MNIYFVRHGDPDYSNDSLTELGKIQAEKLGEAIKEWKIDKIYQSPMGRAKETAGYICSKMNQQAETLDMIREICWGDLSGNAYASDSPWSIIDKLIKKQQAYPKDDSWKTISEFSNDRLVCDVEDRIKQFDDFLRENGYSRQGQLYKVTNPNDKSIMFVCHGGISATLIAHLLNIPFVQFNAHVGIKVTSLSKIILDGEKGNATAAKLGFLNNTFHLNQF